MSVAYNFQDGGYILQPQKYTTVDTGTLPAGNYAVTAPLTVEAVGTGNETVYCNLVAGTTVIYANVVSMQASPDFAPVGGPYVPVSLVGAASLPSGGPVSIQCTPDTFGIQTSGTLASIDATRVGTIGP